MPKGTVDHDRPIRIVRAALEVVAAKGVEGLTHRAVAAAAGIPLGSTTYHFKTLDDLLAAAIVEAKGATDAELLAWSESLEPGEDVVRALAEYVIDVLENHWERTIVELELYLAALRRPSLRVLSQAWDQALPDELRKRLDGDTARALALICDGVFLHAVIHGMPVLEEVEALLRRTAS